MTTTHHMKMQMEDRLASVSAGIDHEAIARFGEPFVCCNLGAGEQEPSKERVVGLTQVLDRRDVTLGNHQRMHRRLGIDVVEGQCVFILIDNLGRDASFDNSAEETCAHTTLLGYFPGLSPDLPNRFPSSW